MTKECQNKAREGRHFLKTRPLSLYKIVIHGSWKELFAKGTGTRKNKHSMRTLRKRVHGRIPQCCKRVIQDVSCQVGILYSAVQRPAFVLQIQKHEQIPPPFLCCTLLCAAVTHLFLCTVEVSLPVLSSTHRKHCYSGNSASIFCRLPACS